MVPSKDEFGVELMGAAAVVEESVVNIGPVGVDTTLEYTNVCTMVVVVVSKVAKGCVDVDVDGAAWEFLVSTVEPRVIGKASPNVDICVETLVPLLTSLVVEKTLTVFVAELVETSMVPQVDVEVACPGRRLDSEYS